MRDIYIDFRSYEDFMNLFHMDIEKSYSLSIIINFPKMGIITHIGKWMFYQFLKYDLLFAPSEKQSQSFEKQEEEPMPIVSDKAAWLIESTRYWK